MRKEYLLADIAPTPNHMRSDLNTTVTIDPSLDERLAKFARSSQTGVWNHLDKRQLIEDIRDRLIDPYQIQQGEQPFCGPASVVFELIRKQPARYIDICQSLYEYGSFDGYTKKITVSGRLCRSYGNLRMAQADWMLLATLRDCANTLVPVHPKAPKLIRELGGITKPWEINGWVKELLGYSTTKSHPTILSGEFRALQEADSTIKAGGVVFGLINSQGLLGSNSFIASRFHRLYPNHWVTILGNISILGTRGYANEPPTKITKNKQSRVQFDMYSWGRKIHVNTDVATIKDFFWGVAVGKSFGDVI
ncbi:hypothetical protein [Chamaesiphon sp. OTE_20_metabat_361]|uniref:hypothetical protein n=1 Tax=Chamaesiphon sp. OTE_20_metabat_361 TaxID=2964689 RepID=UPI00286BC8D4|nr:hypothetical protein [Chamaesiphon sp. OTE_20_metabat_361]